MLLHTTLIALTNSMLMMALISFFLSRKKILMCLLSLEFILLNLFFSLIVTLSLIGMTVSHSIFLLVLGACEASLGLSLIINMTRFKGNDMLTKFQTKF